MREGQFPHSIHTVVTYTGRLAHQYLLNVLSYYQAIDRVSWDRRMPSD